MKLLFVVTELLYVAGCNIFYVVLNTMQFVEKCKRCFVFWLPLKTDYNDGNFFCWYNVLLPDIIISDYVLSASLCVFLHML